MSIIPKNIFFNKDFKQFFGYVFIGFINNIIGYIIYFLLTYLFGYPKIIMTIGYAIGSLFSFFANLKFNFRYDGRVSLAGIRFFITYFSGYLLNIGLLLFFSDYLGFKHYYVQAVAILFVSFYLFILLRIYVFPYKKK